MQLPWWSQFSLSPAEEEEITESERIDLHPIDSAEINQDLMALLNEKIGLELIENGAEHDPITMTFRLDTPPAISFPMVYVEVRKENA
jgi:hypothetical protein